MSFWRPEFASMGGLGDPTARYPQEGRTTVISTQDNVVHSLLAIGPMTAHELSLQLHTPVKEIQSILKRMKESKLVFIYEYDNQQPLYAYGQGRSAKPPVTPQIDHTSNARLAAKKHPELGIWARLI